MPDTCGPTSHEQLTCFDLGSASSKTSKDTSVKAESKSWSRLSQWGTASSGGWFELPTPARLTAVRGSSSTLLPTSRATDGTKGGPNQVNGRGVRDSLPGVAPTLLPTPTSNASTGAGTQGRDGGMNLQTAAALLPTPAVNDMGRGKTVQSWDEWTLKMRDKHGNGNGHGKSLEIEAQRLIGTPTAGLGTGGGRRSHTFDPDSRSGREPNPRELIDLMPTPTAQDSVTDFGPYTAAVRRWEHALGRPTPSPTEPGREGRPRLSPAFVEWLMGLPAGWVTDTDIPRSAQLKALGNGIVPQQALLALQHLTDGDH